MREVITAFYREKKAINVDFSAEEISSDGALVLLEKWERKHQLIADFSKHIFDPRDPFSLITTSNRTFIRRKAFCMLWLILAASSMSE
ncbi:MAG: hypothetical protein AAF600_03205 [Bacteroidota bacterium]